MSDEAKANDRRRAFVDAAIEIAFIIFLFYSNLLMGEFTRGHGRGLTLLLAFRDVITVKNFAIGLVTAVLGHAGFEFMRRRLSSAGRG